MYIQHLYCAVLGTVCRQRIDECNRNGGYNTVGVQINSKRQQQQRRHKKAFYMTHKFYVFVYDAVAVAVVNIVIVYIECVLIRFSIEVVFVLQLFILFYSFFFLFLSLSSLIRPCVCLLQKYRIATYFLSFQISTKYEWKGRTLVHTHKMHSHSTENNVKKSGPFSGNICK